MLKQGQAWLKMAKTHYRFRLSTPRIKIPVRRPDHVATTNPDRANCTIVKLHKHTVRVGRCFHYAKTLQHTHTWDLDKYPYNNA